MHNYTKYQLYLSTIIGGALCHSFQVATNHLSSMFNITTPHTGKTSNQNVSTVSTTGTVGRVPQEQKNAMSSEQFKAHVKKMKQLKTLTDSKITNQKRSATDGMSCRTKQEHIRLRKVASLAQLVEDYKPSGKSATRSALQHPHEKSLTRSRSVLPLLPGPTGPVKLISYNETKHCCLGTVLIICYYALTNYNTLGIRSMMFQLNPIEIQCIQFTFEPNESKAMKLHFPL